VADDLGQFVTFWLEADGKVLLSPSLLNISGTHAEQSSQQAFYMSREIQYFEINVSLL